MSGPMYHMRCNETIRPDPRGPFVQCELKAFHSDRHHSIVARDRYVWPQMDEVTADFMTVEKNVGGESY